MAPSFWKTAVRRVEKKYRIVYKRGPSTVAMFFAGIAIAAWIVFALSSGYPAVQYIYYTVRPATSARLSKVLKELEVKPQEVVAVEEQVDPPPIVQADTTIPEGHYLNIPSIGVSTTIWEATSDNYDEALRKGVWRVPEMAEPDRGSPVIMSAHRFGYIEWTQDYRVKNSFFNLPDLEPGDEIEIVWDQKRYKYKVARLVEGEAIDDYNYDLILYTCKFLVSPIRIMVYANRVN